MYSTACKALGSTSSVKVEALFCRQRYEAPRPRRHRGHAPRSAASGRRRLAAAVPDRAASILAVAPQRPPPPLLACATLSISSSRLLAAATASATASIVPPSQPLPSSPPRHLSHSRCRCRPLPLQPVRPPCIQVAADTIHHTRVPRADGLCRWSWYFAMNFADGAPAFALPS